MKCYTVYTKMPSQNVYGMYAITNSKDILDEFMQYRNPELYKIMEKDVKKNTYKQICKDYAKYILQSTSYVYNENNKDILIKNDNVYILSNEYEREMCTDAMGPLYDIVFDLELPPYEIFNDSIARSLDILMYTYYQLYAIESSGLQELIDHNLSYGLSPVYGISIGGYEINEINVLLSIMRGDKIWRSL